MPTKEAFVQAGKEVAVKLNPLMSENDLNWFTIDLLNAYENLQAGKLPGYWDSFVEHVLEHIKKKAIRRNLPEWF